MAIKGKRKSQKRGGQARRPSAPPRPIVPSRRRVPWYRTPIGVWVSVLVGAGLIGVAVFAIQSSRSDARTLEKRQDALERYTGQMRAFLQTVRTPVETLAAPPQGGTQKQVLKDAKELVQDLQASQAELARIVPPPALNTPHRLYGQAASLYVSAARAYQVAANLTGESQTETLALSSQLRTDASGLWTQASQLLDAARTAADLETSPLPPPDSPAGAATTTVPTSPSVPPVPEEPRRKGGEGKGGVNKEADEGG